MRAPWYKAVFPVCRLAKDTEAEQVTTRGGSRFATSVGGTLTGRGGSLIIIDDPMKPEDALSKLERARVIDWYRSTLYSRLDNKRDDAIVLIMQRLHLDDLAGHVLEEGGWVHLNLPAIAPAAQTIPLCGGRVHQRKPGGLLIPQREPQAVLDDLRAKLGEYHFSAQYLQQPIPEEGALIKRAWFQTRDGSPAREPHDRIVQSWDTAGKAGELNDYSVCVTALAQGNRIAILHVLRERLDYPCLRRRGIAHALAWRADVVLVEDTVAGMALIQDVRAERTAGLARPIAIRPEGDKVMRMAAQSAKIEAGQVSLPKSAAWLEALRAEVLAFPGGAHDGQIDALSQLLAWLTRKRKRAGAW
ncbi:MAG: phage terminase large subunit [Hyphomicrobiales bacterium]|nr:phage terminase large subunit [Hyphomicrobiales bacterium]